MSGDPLWLAGYLVAYAIVHSLLATDAVKIRFKRVCPRLFPIYRLAYTTFSVVTLVPLIPILARSPSLYQIEAPIAYLLRILQIVGGVGFLLSLKAIDLGLFVGLRSPIPVEPSDIDQQAPELSTAGPYGLCRHPLYFFASLFLTAHPLVSQAYAIFTGWTVAYFWFGSWIEERRLINTFGDTYLEYRDRVPHFFPIPYKKKADSSN
jgi:protein-S-isoprenylcysteine O-methyltransferase Ste14